MYYLEKQVEMPFNEAEERVRTLLKEVGFGIITEIDMKATFKKKIDKDIEPYKILGACNPNFAYESIQTEENIGVLLPCNVVLIDKGDKTKVAIMDPVSAMSVVENNNIEPFAQEVKDKLQTVLDKL